MGKSDLSEREKKAFLKSVMTGSSSADDARHSRGTLAVFAVLLPALALDAAIVWFGGWDALFNRGTAMLIVVEIAAAGGAYRMASGLRV
jgi:hypothetical protein